MYFIQDGNSFDLYGTLKDKNAVMTVVMKKAPPGHCSRCREDDVLLVLDSTNDRILHFLKTGNQKKMELPAVCVYTILH